MNGKLPFVLGVEWDLENLWVRLSELMEVTPDDTLTNTGSTGVNGSTNLSKAVSEASPTTVLFSTGLSMLPGSLLKTARLHRAATRFSG